ncbi:Lin1244/Lin1753 domain-containing protein [Holdemania massiliensis]|uniref:Lin1244/Lin1753 domain-containing protein n=1 Tax=Holdemania massiliensis TaxID=1468449 RepID=UPI003568891D
MGAPPKAALWYYPWEVNAFDVDSKLFDLIEEYGPLGESVYRRALDIIYSQSYYFSGTEDQLSMMICKKIGVQWIKRAKCREILLYCVDIGLFDHDLVQDGIWTSAGVQKRYLTAMKMLRRKITDKKYFLEDGDVLNALKKLDSAEETQVNEEETQLNDEETAINAEKGNEIKSKQNETNQIILDQKKYDFLSTLFQDEFGHALSEKEMRSLERLMGKYDADLIVKALKEASMYQKVNFGYITQILKTWKGEINDE